LKKFLIALDDADVLSAHVSQVFDDADLIAIQNFMFEKDTGKLLKLAHRRKWPHEDKWKKYCPVCESKESLNQVVKIS